MRLERTAILLGLLVSGSAIADSLIGESMLLCAPGYVTHCSSGGECETGPPDNYNIPNFVRIDLERQLLLTTEASEEQNVTPIQSVEREEGLIYLQGRENARAFTAMISEVTGDGTMAIIAEGETATAFLACTPD